MGASRVARPRPAWGPALALAALAATLVLPPVTHAGSPPSPPADPEPLAPVTATSEVTVRALVTGQAVEVGEIAQRASPEPEGIRWPLFADAERKVGSGMLAIDPQDGIHVAYAHRIPLADGPRAAYAYCPATAACGAGEGWIGVELGEDVLGVMLATTRDGHPRVLIQQDGTVYPGGRDYHYAACDSDCEQPTSWQIGYVTSTWGTDISDAFLGTQTRRAFALDSHDRPGFVFYDRNYFHLEPDHLGGFYTWCEADCASGTPDAPTWQEVYIGGGTPSDTDIYDLPALAYTSDDRPRMVVEVTTGDAGAERMGIVYKACDADCDRSTSWTHTPIAQRGYETYVSWDLALDAEDRPHVAFYQGSLEGGGGHRLSHLGCVDGCDDASSWTTLDLALPQGDGESPDIEIQPDGRPAISFLRSGGSAVHLIRCVDDCTVAGGWRETILDTGADLEADFPVARPLTCDAGFWDAESTRLAFDSTGRMRVVYDAAYQARCLYEDPERPDDPPYHQFHEVNHAVRILIWDEAIGRSGGPA